MVINKKCQLIPLEGDKLSIRSAIFSDNELKQWFYGQEGINHYLEGYNGRLMMAIKSILGSTLMTEKTVIFNKFVPFTSILAEFISHIKQKAEAKAQTELTQVVLGRPVRFHDEDDAKDDLAQQTLEAIMTSLGFKEVIFQYEPIAAALTYEQAIDSEQLALIIDIGGGTSDFTVIRLAPGKTTCDRANDVLSNCGIHIAGTDFDKIINFKTVMPSLGLGSTVKSTANNMEVPSSFYHDLTTWYTLNKLYERSTLSRLQSIRATANQKQLLSRLIYVLQNRLGHHILNTVESSKQLLSDEYETTLDLSFVEDNLAINLTRNKMNEMIQDHVQKIVNRVEQTITMAGIKTPDIHAVFYTGGSTKIPFIQSEINVLFPQAKIVHGDAFGSVGMGLTLDAQRKFGAY